MYTNHLKLEHSEITEKIIGCAMNVHCKLGSGFQEVIYQRALAVEFEEANLNFAREDEMPIIYKGQQVGIRRVDFFIENKILVEIKAIIQLDNVHLAQGKNYLEAYNIEN